MNISYENRNKSNLDTYFLERIDQYPFSNELKIDSLTQEQNNVIISNNLSIYIPNGFLSLKDEHDKEAFIFIDQSQASLIMAKCFPYNDSIDNQIARSTKYNSPIYGEDYNDLSEFIHFKKCERIITDSIIGPFYFGGDLYDLLGAKAALHQEFCPKSKKFKFGEFTILLDKSKFLFICWLHNGYIEEFDNDSGASKMRWQAFKFLN